MPLRDHFRSPLIDRKSWDGLHGQWPAMMVMALSDRLPQRYAAAPNIHLGSTIEVDVATFDEELADHPDRPDLNDGASDAAVWAPPEPTLVLVTDLLDLDEYEVLVYDSRPHRRLVAAVEIVSPSNKDRPEHRRAFVAKCAGLIQDHVSVTIVDLVTTRQSNLYEELLDFFGQTDSSPPMPSPAIYAATCRWTRQNDAGQLKTWAHSLELGQRLPTVPIWLAENHAIPLDLEATYEETCRILRIP